MLKKRRWEIFWEIPECPPFLTSEPARFFTRQMKDFCGANFQDCILEYQDNTNIWYLDADEWSRLDAVLFNRMLRDIRFAKKINTIADRYCLPCLKFLDRFKKVKFHKLSDEVLYSWYERFMEVYVPAHASGHPANVLEMKNQRLSRYLKTYLLNRMLGVGTQGNVDELFGILTEPVSDMSVQREALSFYRLAIYIAKLAEAVQVFTSQPLSKVKDQLKDSFPMVWKKVLKHAEEYCWTPYNWEGPANDIDYYLESLSSIFRQNAPVKKELVALEQRGRDTMKKQKEFIRKFRIDKKHQTLLKIASDIMFLKALRKDCMYKGAWASEGMFAEIGRRLGLTTHEARFIFRFEMKEALLRKKISVNKIRERTNEVILHQRSNKLDIVLEGKQALDFISSLGVKKPDSNVKEFRGQVAYPGKVVGRVKYVNTPDMISKMEQGDILVAYATQPNLLPAMKKAIAFVTDFGGITCHAAIVAREWKVPCIIGTGIATKVLKDGDLVEVDADKGIVKIIKRST